MHIVGGGVAEYEHFMNWLAAAFQTRKKLGTAWILHGTQGTGKGVFFDHVVSALVGQGVDRNAPYTIKLRQENIEDQFNAWEETALFAALDEFRLDESANANKLFNKIKNMITEEENTVRGMRENARRVRLYTNFFIFTNDEDMIHIPEDDRRFNVAPRQLHTITKIFPDINALIYGYIPKELPLFAYIMRTFVTDMVMARTALDNEAKRVVREVSKTSIDEFVDAIKTGDLEYFIPILDMPHSPAGVDYTTPCKLMLKKFLMEWSDEDNVLCSLTTDQLRMFYCCMIGRIDSTKKFGKLLQKHGITTSRIRIGSVIKRGLRIVWVLQQNSIKDLQDTYCVEMNLQYTQKIVPLRKENAND
jgi:hypothetical protein